MVFLKLFFLLDAQQEGFLTCDFGGAYPKNIFPKKHFSEIEFDPITLFYGGNGSGKSTLLNIICSCLQIKRNTLYTRDMLFDAYTAMCRYVLEENGDRKSEIPETSRLIASDDIFDEILKKRAENMDTQEKRAVISYIPRDDQQIIKELKLPKSTKTRPLKNHEHFVKMRNFKRRSRTWLFNHYTAPLNTLWSNGETVLKYFEQTIEPYSLYLLDEPETCLSPQYQLELKRMLEEAAYRLDCQFVIASHSPFILALDGAKIYDLDSCHCPVRKWYELEHIKTYHDFFRQHAHLFATFHS